MEQYRPRLSKEEYELILEKRNSEKELPPSTFPKILIFDLETSPLIAEMWSPWGDAINILRESFMLCWSAKWLFEDNIISAHLTPKEIVSANDERITKILWSLLDEADIVIAHNLKKFDKKVAQTRFFKHDLKLPSHYSEVDTLAWLRKQFKITYNRLDFVSKVFLGLEGKMETEKGS